MPQSRNEHSHHRHVDVGARLIEDEEVEALPRGELHAGGHLLACVETTELRAEARPDRGSVARHQEGMIHQAQRGGAVETGFLSAAASHQSDRQELVELGQCAQQSDPAVEVRAGAEFDIFLGIVDPVQNRHVARNLEVAGDVEHPKPASGFGKPALQVADVGIVERTEVDLRPLQSVVPPDRVCIPFHQLEEALDDRLLARIAGGAAVGIRVDLTGASIEEKQEAGRNILEALITQRPHRRPFDLGRSIEQDLRRGRLVRIIRCRLLAQSARR